ncbi:hypothetical protein DDB_G0280903 [Dictyostelium discoideum AX4]|uniref:Uncharacterized protein n=1 Tax=Dictyostelium discoideum TaxID=44689 RepID=Q54UP7_DICDI|nr:hypothetical protein DDB_G0280903 [Dictyostelium discoideum AX4]EAL66993.1 hypothetical protein DDB_G0280903 [Dictyostelium discoideum AX4]|eukprot:XP_640974.1 hypothetical protein DDB_G0280903 [Dictyostelium discoideum AX4]
MNFNDDKLDQGQVKNNNNNHFQPQQQQQKHFKGTNNGIRNFNDLKVEFEHIRNNLISLESEISKGKRDKQPFKNNCDNQLLIKNQELKNQIRKYKENENLSEKRLSLQEKYLDEYKSNFNRIQEEIIQIQESINNYKELYNDRNKTEKIIIELKTENKKLIEENNKSNKDIQQLKEENKQLQQLLNDRDKQLEAVNLSFGQHISSTSKQFNDSYTIINKLEDQLTKQIKHYDDLNNIDNIEINLDITSNNNSNPNYFQ